MAGSDQDKSPGQPPLDPATEHVGQEGSPSTVLDSSDETTCEGKRPSTKETPGALFIIMLLFRT